MRRIILTVFCLLLASLCLGLVLLTQPLAGKHASSPPSVDSKRLETHVKYLSVTLYPRSHDHWLNLDKSAFYIKAQFAAAGARVSTQEYQVGAHTYQNIIANFGPSSGPSLVIGAHYDSHGDSEEGKLHPSGRTRDSHTPGADDNASGVAALIELAHLLGRQRQTRAIELVAYTLEEPPHFRTHDMGSSVHARALRAKQQEVSLMLSLECIGFYSNEKGSQDYPSAMVSAFYPSEGNFIALVGRMADFGLLRQAKAVMAGATALPVRSMNAPAWMTGIDFSDHLNYWQAGYPALMITDTAFMRNPHYHLAGDTHEKLNYDKMVQVVQGVYALTQSPW